MSDYTTYTNYAKKAIDELQQLATFKKSLKGKKLADKIREAGLKLITKSGVDSILHGLGESNGFQNLTPAQKQIAEKLVSLKDTALTHKSSSIQGVLDENAEMAQSDITKIIDYSEKLQSMFDVNDNLEDWVKAKLNHACDYVATVRDYLKFYNEEKEKGTQNIEEKWSNTYKKSIDCSNAKGFSQKAHCAGRTKRKNEDMVFEEITEDILNEFVANADVYGLDIERVVSHIKHLDAIYLDHLNMDKIGVTMFISDPLSPIGMRGMIVIDYILLYEI